ncbi:hypothetical protein RJZ56_006707 [Blastomyces dermatitidis]
MWLCHIVPVLPMLSQNALAGRQLYLIFQAISPERHVKTPYQIVRNHVGVCFPVSISAPFPATLAPVHLVS